MANLAKSTSQMVLLILLCLSGNYASEYTSVKTSEKANFYLKSGLKAYKSRNYSRALQDFQEAADLGSGEACYHLGLMYKNGQGTSKKYLRALQYYQKAGELGDARGYYNLGVMYKYGIGVKQDKRTAQRYFQQACDLDHQDGCEDVEGTEPYQDLKNTKSHEP